MDYKKRVKQALENHYAKQEYTPPEPRRKNQKPEKQVEQEILLWCNRQQWDVDVIEAKAKFNTATMQYTGRAASPGVADIIGNTQNGLSTYIELKSKGRRVGSALAPKQRAFLTRKIRTGCFAVMADSVEYIDRVWSHFCSLPTKEHRVAYLLNELPDHNQRQLKLNQKPGTGDADDLGF